MKRWLRLLTLLALAAMLFAPSALRPAAQSASPRLVVFEGFYAPT